MCMKEPVSGRDVADYHHSLYLILILILYKYCYCELRSMHLCMQHFQYFGHTSSLYICSLTDSYCIIGG